MPSILACPTRICRYWCIARWLAWRGPTGDGQAERETKAPLKWSKQENVKWRVELDGPGNSTPIVVGKRLFLTHSPEDSKLRGLLGVASINFKQGDQRLAIIDTPLQG